MKKKKPRNLDRNARAKMYHPRLHPVEVQLLMDMIEGFVAQLKRDEVWVDDKTGEALIDVMNEGVIELSRKGLQPKKARPNLNGHLEFMFQIVALCHSDEDLDKMNDQIESFRRKIIQPLELNAPIQRSALVECDEMLADMRMYLLNTPAHDIVLVNNNIYEMIMRTNGKCTVNEMRVWLVDEIKRRMIQEQAPLLSA